MVLKVHQIELDRSFIGRFFGEGVHLTVFWMSQAVVVYLNRKSSFKS